MVGQRSRLAAAVHASWWYALAVLFAFLGIDEGAQLHEALGEAVKAVSDTQFGASWSFVYVPAALRALPQPPDSPDS